MCTVSRAYNLNDNLVVSAAADASICCVYYLKMRCNLFNQLIFYFLLHSDDFTILQLRKRVKQKQKKIKICFCFHLSDQVCSLRQFIIHPHTQRI
jgi:hypothetical protein